MDGLSWSCADTVVIGLDGMTASDDLADFRFQLHRAIRQGAWTIVVDTSSLRALPSTLIAAVLIAHRSCRRRGGYVILRNPSHEALNQLQRTGLEHLLQEERTAAVSGRPA